MKIARGKNKLTKEQIEILKYCHLIQNCCDCKYANGHIPCEVEEVVMLQELLAAYDRIELLESQIAASNDVKLIESTNYYVGERERE